MRNQLLLITLAGLIGRTTTFSLVIPIIIILLIKTQNQSVKLAFFSGIISDLLLGTSLGFYALLFIFFSGQLKLLSTRIPSSNWWTMLLLTFIFSIETQTILGQFSLRTVFIQVILALIFWFSYSIFEGRGQIGEVFLKNS